MRHVSALVGLALLAGSATTAWAGTCALCRQALASGGSAGLVKGFYWSILLMTSVPLALLVAGSLLLWRRWGATGARSRLDGRPARDTA